MEFFYRQSLFDFIDIIVDYNEIMEELEEDGR